MRSISGRPAPSVTVGTALAAGVLVLGALAGCSAGADPDAAAGSGTATPTSAAPVATAPPSSVTVDTTEVATDPEPDATATTTTTTTTGTGAQPDRPQPVTVTTTYAAVLPGASAVEAGGYVDVVELGGACTLTLTRGDDTRTATAEATPDATTTACGGLEIPLSDLGSGTWQAVLGYESRRSAGEAPAVEVEVP